MLQLLKCECECMCGSEVCVFMTCVSFFSGRIPTTAAKASLSPAAMKYSLSILSTLDFGVCLFLYAFSFSIDCNCCCCKWLWRCCCLALFLLLFSVSASLQVCFYYYFAIILFFTGLTSNKIVARRTPPRLLHRCGVHLLHCVILWLSYAVFYFTHSVAQQFVVQNIKLQKVKLFFTLNWF